jgi:hypothetical protein
VPDGDCLRALALGSGSLAGWFCKCLPPSGWLFNEQPPARLPIHGVAGKEESTTVRINSARRDHTHYGQQLFVIMIGIDPHKGSHTAVALDADEHVLAELRVRAHRRQTERAAGMGRAVCKHAPGRSTQPPGWATCWPNS